MKNPVLTWTLQDMADGTSLGTVVSTRRKLPRKVKAARPLTLARPDSLGILAVAGHRGAWDAVRIL